MNTRQFGNQLATRQRKKEIEYKTNRRANAVEEGRSLLNHSDKATLYNVAAVAAALGISRNRVTETGIKRYPVGRKQFAYRCGDVQEWYWKQQMLGQKSLLQNLQERHARAMWKRTRGC